MKKFVVLAALLMLFSTGAFAQGFCGCNETERGSVLKGRVSDVYGLGGPNLKVVAFDSITFEEIWDYTDVDGYYEFKNKETYPPLNFPLRRCTAYNVHVESFQVTPFNITAATNPTNPQCPDPTQINFMLNY